jgi:hypothetical protein
MAGNRRTLCLAAAAALLAAGCVSASPSPEVKAARDGLTVCDSRFMRTGPMDDSTRADCAAPSRSAEPPEVLRPDRPWIGTVGLTTALSDSMHFGLGIEVPNPVDSRTQTIALADRLQDTGVGAWISIDF